MTNVQDHGILPTNSAITNTASLRAVMVLSDSAHKLVDFILQFIAKMPPHETFIENGVKRQSWFLNHEYPIMEDRNHETGKQIPQQYIEFEDTEEIDSATGKKKQVAVTKTRMVKEVVIIQEQAWVHCSKEVIEETEDHLMSLGYRCDRPDLKTNNDAEFAHLPPDERPPIRRKPLRGCFVVPPIKVK